MFCFFARLLIDGKAPMSGGIQSNMAAGGCLCRVVLVFWCVSHWLKSEAALLGLVSTEIDNKLAVPLSPGAVADQCLLHCKGPDCYPQV